MKCRVMPCGYADTVTRRGLQSALLLTAALLSGCTPQGNSFFTPGGPVAQSEQSHFFVIAAISLVAILPVLILTPLIVWRYRRHGGKGRYVRDWDYSRILEMGMWGVPVLIVAVLTMQLVRNTLELDPYRPIASEVEPLRVEAVALNWKWLFILPDHGIATVDELAIPVGVPVAFRLTSDSGMQSFLVSALAGQIYVMPGMATRQVLMADRPGSFAGRNTQFNGRGFAGQRFVVEALPKNDFEAWVERARDAGHPLEAGTYAVLAKPSSGSEAAQALGASIDRPLRFAPVQADLFTTILHRYMRPGGAPPTGTPGAVVHSKTNGMPPGHAGTHGATP
ncbi:MAG: hypothetical protein Q8R82_21170 [Hyphomonadaceae bacterium]|nr:hypothetical protein [Hyphomonadaceae bacterium]